MGENTIPQTGDPYPFPMGFTPQCLHLAWLVEHLDGWQFGEQGLIPAVIDAVGAVGRCVEYGAGDGECLPLTIDRMYAREPVLSVLVEIDDERRERLATGDSARWQRPSVAACTPSANGQLVQ